MKPTALLLLLLLIAFGSQAQTSYTWNGSTSTAWTTAANWTPNGTPGTGDNVTVGGGTNILTLAANTTVNNLTMSAGTVRLGGYVLTSTGQVQLLGGKVENGKFIHNSATQTATFYNTTLDCKVQTTGKVASMNASKFKDSLNMSITQGFNGGGNKFYDTQPWRFRVRGKKPTLVCTTPTRFLHL